MEKLIYIMLTLVVQNYDNRHIISMIEVKYNCGQFNTGESS